MKMKINNVLFLGNFYSDDYLINQNLNLSVGNDNYEKKFISVLSQISSKVIAYSFPDYSLKNKKQCPQINKSNNKIDNCEYIVEGFYNKNIRNKKIKDFLLSYKIINNFDYIFISTYHYANLISYIKKIFTNSKLILILPDLPSIGIENYGPRYKLKRKSMDRYLRKNLNLLNGLIPITMNISKFLGFDAEKTFIFEGFEEISFDITNKKYEKTIIYAGSLKEEYGIMSLVNSFLESKSSKEYKLLICGSGSLEKRLIDISSKNPNISYVGRVKKEDAILLEFNSSLIVIPDSTDRPYSFHSKYIESLASGTPCLTYLPSGGKDQYTKLMVNINDFASLSDAIDEILLNKFNFYKSIGINSFEFMKKIDKQYFANELLKFLIDIK